ncbi:radical SAM protein [Helicobacter japonicus]|uniref:radical SAM protein n=8 Tax=Helicobacter japonicus TaxID=425400 RepID=UPI0025991F03|nr:radical SAM protein [Helicobacter japonicus]
MKDKIIEEIKRIPRIPRSIYKRFQKMLRTLLPESVKAKYFNTLENLVVISGQNCSLKCKNCANFSPYLAKMIPFYPYEEICADIEEITKHTQIKNMQLQGGEFFLHPNATQILEYVAGNPRIHRITIATNATIVPKDSILSLIKESGKIRLRLSNYGEANHKSAQKLESTLTQWKIPYWIHCYASGDGNWVDCGGKSVKRLKESVVQKIFKECIFGQCGGCLTMENGFISKCSRAVVAHLVQGFALGKNDGILVRQNAQRIFSAYNVANGGGGVELPAFSFDTLQNFLASQTPLQACYYCYGTSGQEIPAGVQLSKEELNFINTPLTSTDN